MTNDFKNPYTASPDSPIYIGRKGGQNNVNLANVQFTVHRDHKHYLKRIRPDVGTHAICMSILYKKLIEAIDERAIDTSEGLEAFVTQCKIVQ